MDRSRDQARAPLLRAIAKQKRSEARAAVVLSGTHRASPTTETGADGWSPTLMTGSHLTGLTGLTSENSLMVVKNTADQG